MALKADVDNLVNKTNSSFTADNSLPVTVSELTELVDDLSDISDLSELSEDSDD